MIGPNAPKLGRVKMKILIISDYAYPSGGAEVMILRLRDELCRRGHDARIFSTALAGEEDGNFADYTCHGTETRLRTLLQTANPFAVHSLSKVLKSFQPDIVHVRMFLTQLSPLILPLLRDVPSIYHLAWYRAICPTGTKTLPNGQECRQKWGRVCLSEGCHPLHDWLALMTQMKMMSSWIGAFDQIVANSNAVQARFAKEGFETSVIHNGIPVSKISGTFPKEPSVFFAGRLVTGKGCHILIEAFANVLRVVPNAQLVIAGDGAARLDLATLVQDLGLKDRVTFLGKITQKEISDQIQRAWVQVVPSLWQEPFGITAIEAMMHARPVIASNAGGLKEIVEPEQTGYLFEPGDIDALSKHLIDLLTDAQKAVALGKSARSRAVDNFSLDSFTDQFIDLYTELTSSDC